MVILEIKCFFTVESCLPVLGWLNNPLYSSNPWEFGAPDPAAPRRPVVRLRLVLRSDTGRLLDLEGAHGRISLAIYGKTMEKP